MLRSLFVIAMLLSGQSSPPVTPPAAPPVALPACDGPEFRQFDFWVGTWDVAPASQPKATGMSNVITKGHRGCVIREQWTGLRMTGESVNIYDRSRGKWHQTWVDSTGGLLEFWGASRGEGVMAFEGEQPSSTPGGKPDPTRMSFTRRPDGTVRQLAEVSEDAGKTWKVTVDLIYTKRTK